MSPKRKHDSSIPAHIDQRHIPTGIYWNRRDRYWYAMLMVAGKRKRSARLAGPEAMLSELVRESELSRGIDTRKLDYMLEAFELSDHYTGKAVNTQADYGYCRLALQRYKTKLGIPFAHLETTKITAPLVQVLIDNIAKTTPAKANHIKRYLSVAFAWGCRRGYCVANPAKGVEQAEERKAHRMPERDTMRDVINLLRKRGAYASRRPGAVAPYVWAVAEIAYRCRMRSVEVRMLTDEDASEAGIHVRRVKGSNDNLTAWCPELREAWSWLIARRARIWLKKASGRPVGVRSLVVSEDGRPLSKGALSSAWRRAMAVAIEAKVIEVGERFGLHGLKHRGVTDTAGTVADKKQASGHRTDAMAEHYNHELAVVDAAGVRK
jgi:hypothetical protein